MYRRTRKYAEHRQHAMQAARDAARLAADPPAYPMALPDLRMTITIDRHDVQPPSHHVVELHSTRRVDVYRATVDGMPWITAGLSSILAGIRKGLPRMMSPRAMG